MLRIFVLAGLVAFSSALPSKIIGGHDVEITSAPYQASLQLSHHHVCGAALISNTHALTAATCVNSNGNPSYEVRVGSAQVNSGGTVVNVKNINVHPNWKVESLDYDVAILTLETPVEFSENVQAVKLPPADMANPNTGIATSAGWGFVKEGATALSETLQSVELPIVSKIACRALYPDYYTERMMCAGRPLGGIGPCTGDSGNALVLDDQLIGLTSWSIGCARPNYPSVSSFVPKFRDFINEVTGL